MKKAMLATGGSDDDDTAKMLQKGYLSLFMPYPSIK